MSQGHFVFYYPLVKFFLFVCFKSVGDHFLNSTLRALPNHMFIILDSIARNVRESRLSSEVFFLYSFSLPTVVLSEKSYETNQHN